MSLPFPVSSLPLVTISIFSVPGDASAARNMDESEIDKRVAEAIDMEDLDMLMDLRYQNANRSDKYSVFWAKYKQFLDECRAVHATHIDVHYCAALFRYLKQYALKLREHALMACLDDKHRIKVGEPGLPVASVESGQKVLVSLNQSFEVCDHDFTRFSLIPSVTLLIDIPDAIGGSWY